MPPFTANTTSLTNVDERINVRMLQSVADNLKAGASTGFMPTADGGMVVHLRERIPVSEEKLKQELPDFLNRLRLYRQNEAFNQWFRKQAEQAKLIVPQKEQPAPATAGQPPAARKS